MFQFTRRITFWFWQWRRIKQSNYHVELQKRGRRLHVNNGLKLFSISGLHSTFTIFVFTICAYRTSDISFLLRGLFIYFFNQYQTAILNNND